MSQSGTDDLTEFTKGVADRIDKIIEKAEETELKITSKTFSDFQVFIYSYGTVVDFNFRIQNPIKYIKENTLGVPKTLAGFEHPKINKFIYDINIISTRISVDTKNVGLEFYEPEEQSVLYHTRIDIL